MVFASNAICTNQDNQYRLVVVNLGELDHALVKMVSIEDLTFGSFTDSNIFSVTERVSKPLISAPTS